MAKEKKPRPPKAPKAPTTTEDLVLQALKKAATKPGANWTAATATGLFSTKEQNYQQAIDECTKADRPLLKQSGKSGVLTAAGFERVAGELSDTEATAAFNRLVEEVAEEEVGALAQIVAARLPLGPRIEFIQDVIRRTPLAAVELEGVLKEAVAAVKAELDARVEAARKRKEKEDAAEAALKRVAELFAERRRNRLDALRREYEIEGGKASELPELKKPDPHPIAKPGPTTSGPEPKTDEEKDFRRYTTDRLAAAWRDEFDAGRTEGCNALETAIWNIRGMKVIGEVGQQVAFDGRLHESGASIPIRGAARIVRPGWLLKIDDEDYVALRAAVEPM